MSKLRMLSLCLVLALMVATVSLVAAKPAETVVETLVDHVLNPLERSATLEIRVPTSARTVRLVYEQLSFDRVHTIEVPIAGNRARAMIPAEHTTQPGLRYVWEVEYEDGTTESTESIIPFIDTVDIMSPGTHIAHDMIREGGKLPDGTSIPSGRGRIPHDLTPSSASVSSKLLEVRNISTSYVHRGLDFSMTVGNTIRAMEAGVVHVSGNDPDGWGQYVMLKHDNGKYYTIYAHLSVRSVSGGATVSKGQKIGESGNTGSSTGPHLHTSYHVYVSGQRVELYPFWYFMGSLGGYAATKFDYIQVPVNAFDFHWGSNTQVNIYGKGSGSPWVRIVWRRKGTSTWTESVMTQISGTNTYRYWWDPVHEGRTMEYYIKAGKSTVSTTHWVTRPAKFHSGNPGKYYEIVVQRGANALVEEETDQ